MIVELIFDSECAFDAASERNQMAKGKSGQHV